MSQQAKPASKTNQRINNNITSPEVRLVDTTGKMIGVVSLQEALKQAKEADLDLVEIAPDSKPPVCKIMNYGKFLYTQSKQQRLHKAKQKKIELKALRIGFKIEPHDLEVKLKQTYKFLDQGHKVKLDMYLRGREKAFADQAAVKMKNILNNLPENIRLEQELKKSPQGFSVILAKKI
ncbi:MAG: translation initiation factor [Candidatus Parcubacteria bacterium]|jgi:translation initiation factor IF-3